MRVWYSTKPANEKQGSCLVYIREISECYISRLTQDLEFIFRASIRSIMINNGQD
jgi:hypothetical protein